MVRYTKLPVQLWLGKGPPVEEKFEPALNYGASRKGGYMKPVGGMWTSTWETAFEDGWPNWCLGEGFREDSLGEAWLLTPKPMRVIELAGFHMVHEFMKRYAERLYSTPGLDDQPYYNDIEGIPKEELVGTSAMCPVWERVAEDADAVRLLTPYAPDVRLGPYMAFYGWDCESTVWLRWGFEDEAEAVDLTPHVEQYRIDHPPYDWEKDEEEAGL